jgi:HSP20 family molecular chaperone IbpA
LLRTAWAFEAKMSLPSPHTGGAEMPTMDPKLLAAMDAPLIDLANKSGGDLRHLLFAFFSFLHRRTDFYVVPNDDDINEGVPLKMGFREGDAEKLLLAAFRQFPLRKMPSTTKDTTSTSSAKKTAPLGSTNVSEANVSSSVAQKEESPDSKTGKRAKKASAPVNKLETKHVDAIRLTEEGLQVPVGNGGTTNRYTWTQTIDETSVLAAVPEGTKGKDLAVSLKTSSIAIAMKKALEGEDEPRTLLEGDLVEKIRTDESTWSLESGVLVLTLDKLKKTWWDTVLVGDDKIDTTLVDSRRHIDQYDESTQGALRKILFDQRQERLGQPTSDEIRGKVPQIPPLPKGVEYIDKSTLENHAKGPS